MVLPLLLIGVGIPALTAFLEGEFPGQREKESSRDVANKIRKIALASIVGVAVAGIGLLLAQPTAPEFIPPEAAAIQMFPDVSPTEVSVF